MQMNGVSRVNIPGLRWVFSLSNNIYIAVIIVINVSVYDLS